MAVSGGYEGLLEYENRENADTFINNQAYIDEKSREYQRETEKLRESARRKGILVAMLILEDVGVCFCLKKQSTMKYRDEPDGNSSI